LRGVEVTASITPWEGATARGCAQPARRCRARTCSVVISRLVENIVQDLKLLFNFFKPLGIFSKNVGTWIDCDEVRWFSAML
jgi:hypothetical protein